LPEIWIAPTWESDRHWRRGFEKLSAEQQVALTSSLEGLVRALGSCRHPHLDPAVAPWSPTRWNAPGRQRARGSWIEYRLGDEGNKARVIVCHDSRDDRIYLVARTAIHDHDRLSALVAQFR